MLEQSLEMGSPLHMDEDGAIRVAQTRVTLDSILWSFRSGASAEGIAEKYPSLDLGDVYAVIAYYLWNRERVDDYLARRSQEEELALGEITARFPREGLRERLLARRSVGTSEA
ncbi:MAG TPA: DUF433 domain-containing protein [Armatimonadota bacterium]